MSQRPPVRAPWVTALASKLQSRACVNVIVLQLFVSLMLVGSSVLLFVLSVRQRDHDHADRLSLFPLENDEAKPAASPREEAR